MPEAQAEPAALAERVKSLALALGFDRAGIARLDAPPPHAGTLHDWFPTGRLALTGRGPLAGAGNTGGRTRDGPTRA